MARSVFLFYILLFSYSLTAQNNVRIVISDLPAGHPSGDAVYIAGSFNGWNPKNEDYRLQKNDEGKYFIDLKLNPGKYEYKITRGGWDKVECQRNGVPQENRILFADNDHTETIVVKAWQDSYPSRPREHTANKHVQVIDTAFLIPQLNRARRIWIYLPEAYASSSQRFPVLYMHDGQNVFDGATSYSGEWGVDECIDSMRKKCIVVGIDNGLDKRINEYCPYDFSLKTLGLSQSDSVNKGEGDQYVDFLVMNLKPFIDKNYRTLKDRKNTFVAGSSMGGIISMYAIIKYPKVFGGAGVFSPAFWVGPKIFDDIKAKGKKVNAKIYFYAGKLEGETMVPLTIKAFDEMSKVSRSKMTTVIRAERRRRLYTQRRNCYKE